MPERCSGLLCSRASPGGRQTLIDDPDGSAIEPRSIPSRGVEVGSNLPREHADPATPACGDRDECVRWRSLRLAYGRRAPDGIARFVPVTAPAIALGGRWQHADLHRLD